jgi:hypothetical protein
VLNNTDVRIQAQLQAYRQARDAAEKALRDAREEIRPLLTVRQEW